MEIIYNNIIMEVFKVVVFAGLILMEMLICLHETICSALQRNSAWKTWALGLIICTFLFYVIVEIDNCNKEVIASLNRIAGR